MNFEYDIDRKGSKPFEGPGIGQYLRPESPHVLGRALQRPGRLALKQIRVRYKVTRTPRALRTRWSRPI